MRRHIARRYDAAFGDDKRFAIPPDGEANAYHLYPLRVRAGIGRDAFIAGLKDKGIGVSVHFIPLHIMPYYKTRYGLAPEDFPETMRRFESEVSLPIWPGMTEAMITRVIGCVRECAQ
jgi:dTDP-4-amino-4,6-dideoxygalactose transaminase